MIYGELYGIVNRHFTKLEEASGKIDKELEKEAIHDFRTTYKKLRAWLRLLNFAIVMPAKIKIPKPGKEFYHSLGEIRDRQIQCETILTKTQGHPVTPDEYFQVLKNEIGKFGDLSEKKEARKSFVQEHKKIPSEVRESDRIIEAGKYLETKWDIVIGMVRENQFEDEQLHTIRKILKDIYYITYKEDDTETVPEENVYLDENEFKNLLDDIGKFQDLCTALELLCDDTIKKIKGKENRLLRKVRNILTEDKITVKIEVIDKLISLVNFVLMKREEEAIEQAYAESI